MNGIRIVVASPSPVDRSRLARTLASRPDLELIAQTGDLSEAYMLCEAQEPDIVLIAQDFATTDEFDCMKSLFFAVNARWIEIGGSTKSLQPRINLQDVSQPQQAIRAEMSGDEIASAIKLVLANWRPREIRLGKPNVTPAPRSSSERVVLIGASTGGVDALLTVLSHFPANCAPTAVVQHTGRGFSDSLIRLLDRRCAAEVQAAQIDLALRPGLICVAAGSERHLRLANGAKLRATLTAGQPISGHMPSVDELFLSAVPLASKVIAVLLTGMGRDGAAGMLALQRAGAKTIGQDEATSVVYGMPRAAWEIGAVQQQLALHAIGPEVVRLCAQDVRSSAASR